MKLKKIIDFGMACATATYITGCATISDEDYKKAKWLPYNTRMEGSISKAFRAEKIGVLSTSDWGKYIQMVKEHNNGKTEGEIKVPDLDGNGKVGL